MNNNPFSIYNIQSAIFNISEWAVLSFLICFLTRQECYGHCYYCSWLQHQLVKKLVE